MDRRVENVITFIHSHFHQDITLHEMAQSVNLSTWWLCHIFKIEMGMPPERYLKLHRIQKARELLETSFLSVKQIMAIIGLKDESSFVRSFKKIYGVPPGRYRANLARGELRESSPPPH